MHPPMLPVPMTPVRAMQLQPRPRTRPRKRKQSLLARGRLLPKQTQPVTMGREGGGMETPGPKMALVYTPSLVRTGGEGTLQPMLPPLV